MNRKRAMLEAVGNLEWTGDFFPTDEYYGGAFAILVSALGKLTDDEREAALAKIEGGHLRQEVEEYRALQNRSLPSKASTSWRTFSSCTVRSFMVFVMTRMKKR